METPASLENVLIGILANPDHHLYSEAKKFQKFAEELFRTPTGRDFIYFLCGLAHPYRHAPCSDPVISAHLSGRAEVTAMLLRLASPEQTPIVPDKLPPQTNTLWADPPKKKANAGKRPS
jgi:hypothetical protein